MKVEISRHWHPPASKTAWTATAHFKLLKDGTVKALSITSSSGNREWDQSCLDAIRNASGEKLLPENKRLLPASVHFTFEYKPMQENLVL